MNETRLNWILTPQNHLEGEQFFRSGHVTCMRDNRSSAHYNIQLKKLLICNDSDVRPDTAHAQTPVLIS